MPGHRSQDDQILTDGGGVATLPARSNRMLSRPNRAGRVLPVGCGSSHMLGRRLLAVVTIVSLLAIGHSGSSIGVAANPSAECAQLAWYAGELMAVGERIDADEATGP